MPKAVEFAKVADAKRPRAIDPVIVAVDPAPILIQKLCEADPHTTLTPQAILLPEPPEPTHWALEPKEISLSAAVDVLIPIEVACVPEVDAPVPNEIHELPEAVLVLPKLMELAPTLTIPDPKAIPVLFGVAFAVPFPWRWIPPVKSIKVDTIISC